MLHHPPRGGKAQALTLEEKVLYPRESRWVMSELRGSSPKGEFNPTIT